VKFENTNVYNFENAFRGMRNPKNSWDKSDSGYGCDGELCSVCMFKPDYCEHTPEYVVGEDDLKLAQKLIKGGSEHRKFMRQIFVSVDITAPLFWWKEFDTYKVGTVANSTSTMHKLATTPITIDCFETDDMIDLNTVIINYPNLSKDYTMSLSKYLMILIDTCEGLRLKYLETEDKRYWKELIRWLPESWLQTRTVTMNYENVLNICNHRKSHKLNEWSGADNSELPNFISWAKTLPYAQDLIFINEQQK
jgi:hypothetical protein